jgi:hypothetical protein
VVRRCECADFQTLGEDLGQFDRIVMNPPFDHGADINHIKHDFALLAPGGRLVAVCANGPRQREELGEVCTLWIDLPAGSFREQGTNVNTAIVVLDTLSARAEAHRPAGDTEPLSQYLRSLR